jgi:hypothetical protein
LVKPLPDVQVRGTTALNPPLAIHDTQIPFPLLPLSTYEILLVVVAT